MAAPVRQQALTALFRVGAGQFEALGRAIAEAAPNLERALVPLVTLHSARLARIPKTSAGATADELLLATTFDGPLDAHLAELWAHAGPALGNIFARCDGWLAPGTAANFARFVRAASRPAAALYCAQPSLSVVQVRADAALRRAVAEELDRGGDELRVRPALEIARTLRDHCLSRGLVVADERTPPRSDTKAVRVTSRRVLSRRAGELVFMLLRTLLHDSVDFVRELWRETEAQAAHLAATSPSRLTEEAADRAGRRHFTHVSLLKRGRFRRAALRLALSVTDELARAIPSNGGFRRLLRLHAARWLLFDDGRLLFLGEHDGALGPELLLDAGRPSALASLIWSHTRNFPRGLAWFFGGVHRATKFRHFARGGELAAGFEYCAYPGLGVREIRENAALRAILGSGELDPERAERLLALVKD